MKQYKKSDQLNLQDLIFIVVVSVFIGIIWMLYGILFHMINPVLTALNMTGLVRGIWSISGGFFGIIIRKKYSAFLGNLLPSIVEMSFSSWGFYNLLYGILEGIAAESLFLSFGYNKITPQTMYIANIAVSITTFIIDCLLFHLYQLSISANIFRLFTDILSTIIFSVMTMIIIQRLLKLGYLSQYKISQSKLN